MNTIDIYGKKIKVVTVIVSHRKLEEVLFHYNWHKKYSSNVRVLWNQEVLAEEDKVDPNNEDIIPIDVKQGRASLDKICTESLIYFQADDPDYYIFFGWDAFIIREDFEKNSVSFMSRHWIFAMFPLLESTWSSPQHPYVKAEPFKNLPAKQWSVTEGIVLHRHAVKHYYESTFHKPLYWYEVRMPTILGQAGFHITTNPFLDHRFFRHKKEGSMSKEMIKEAVKESTGIIHPIKDYKLLELLKES